MEKKSWEKWCLRTRLGSWKPSDGEKRAEKGSETVNQVHLQDQGGFTPPFCPQGLVLPVYFIMSTDTLKGREVWVKIQCLAVKPGRCHIQRVQDTPGSGIQAFFASPVRTRSAAGMRGSDKNPAMQNKNRARRRSSSINPLCVILGDD